MSAPSPSEIAAKISTYIQERSRRWAKLPGNVRGAGWMMLAAFAFTIMVTLIKIAGQNLHITEILLFRQFFMMALIMPVLARNFPAALKTSRPGLHIIRIAGATGGMVLGFSAYIHLPLADATTIGFSKSFFTTILAIVFLSETVGLRRWGAIIAGFIGVIVVMAPLAGLTNINIYSLMALGGAASAALVMVIIRKISQTDRPVTILAYQAIGVGLLMVAPAIWFWRMPDMTEWFLLLAIGVVSVGAQMGNILAYRAGEASAVASFEYIRLIYAVVLGFFLFAHWPDMRVFLGAAIIIVAAVYTIQREARLGKKQKIEPSSESSVVP